MTAGWGAVVEATPLQAAMLERGVYPGPGTPPMSGDGFVAAVAGLPLAFQPGEGWLYDTGMALLGVLLERAGGAPLSELLAALVTGPLGMTSTAFWTAQPDRLATAYRPGPAGLEVTDPPDGAYARLPRFESLSAGLVSTAGDLLRFFSAMADGGAPVLGPESVARLSADTLTPEQRRQALPIVGRGRSWALGTAVDVEAVEPWMALGRWGWDGGRGTTARVDPSREIVGVLLTQREMTGPLDGFDAFWAGVAAAQG
jgi:CubicO group peptidase (beta-lactamase class C family)